MTAYNAVFGLHFCHDKKWQCLTQEKRKERCSPVWKWPFEGLENSKQTYS